jgi:hypothetical protein
MAIDNQTILLNAIQQQNKILQKIADDISEIRKTVERSAPPLTKEQRDFLIQQRIQAQTGKAGP